MSSSFDILSDALDSLHICGSLLLHESYTAPWAIALPGSKQLGKLLKVQPGIRTVAFHLVERGYIELTTHDGIAHSDIDKTAPSTPPLVVEAGEMVICFGGNPHHISQGTHPQIFPVKNVFAGEEIPFRHPVNLRGSAVMCLCGVFYLQDTHLNPLFSALPPILHAPVSQAGTFHNLSGVANLIAQELDQPSPGSDFMVERLLELLCVGAIRSYMDKFQPQRPNWLTGLQDPIVSKALSMVHANPSHDWSITTLSQNVDLSPSRFAARFKETLGESPMGYVSKWRIHIASGLLKSTENNISVIASAVGYDNLAAFNRAFKRQLEVPPGA